MIISTASPADADAVASLFATHLHDLGVEPDPLLDSDMADFPMGYSGERDCFAVAKSNEGRLLGMAGVLNGEIRRVHVIPEFRHCGVASHLVQHLISTAHALGKRPLYAVIAQNNSASQRLFQRQGFHPAGKTPSHPKMQHCEIWEETDKTQTGV